MGLLDDAIREHLELKRRRGADPGEVAREQREALDPVPRREPPAEEGEIAVRDRVTGAEPLANVPSTDEEHADQGQIDDDLMQEPGGADIGETAEIDMQRVLDGEEHDTMVEGAEGDIAATDEAEAADATGPLPEQDSLEWEVPGAESDEQASQASGASAPEDEPSAEDVLEETPDFLRDTPEQERLWFEQRPPRDFDFDK